MEYLSGESGGYENVAKKYGIPYSTLRNWINKYNSDQLSNVKKKNQ